MKGRIVTMYQLGDVARAAGEKPGTVQLWLSRGYLVMSDKDRDSAGTGRVRLFSFETAMQVAVGAAIVRQGISARRAMKAATRFAHTGMNRTPGRPFIDGDTFLVLCADQALVVETDTKNGILRQIPQHFREAFTAVDAGAIYHRAASALGGDPSGDWRDQSTGDTGLVE